MLRRTERPTPQRQTQSGSRTGPRPSGPARPSPRLVSCCRRCSIQTTAINSEHRIRSTAAQARRNTRAVRIGPPVNQLFAHSSSTLSDATMARSTRFVLHAVEVADLSHHQQRPGRRVQATRAARDWRVHGHEVDVVPDRGLSGDRLNRVLGVEFLVFSLERFERLVGEVGRVAGVRSERHQHERRVRTGDGHRPRRRRRSPRPRPPVRRDIGMRCRRDRRCS